MSKITQRLIAAGATPERARAFEQQFIKKVQTAQPSLGKPQDIQDAFDAEIAAFSAAQYPFTFKPPTVTDPRIDDYIKGAYSEDVLNSIRNKSFQFKAPDLYKILKANPNIATTPDASLPLDALIVKKIYIEQVPIGQLKNDLASGTYSVTDPKTKIKKPITGALLPSEYGALVDKYSGQDSAQLEEETKLKGEFLAGDKYYKVGLPTPQLEYGLKENLAEGVIDFRTHPSILRITNSPEYKERPLKQLTGALPSAPSSAPLFEKAKEASRYTDENLLGLLQQEKAKPFFDEVKRREFLKGKSLRPGK